MRNIIGREKITSGQTNELAHALWILVLLQKLYGRQNGTRQHYAILPGSTASYGKCFQSVHSKIMLTYVLTYLGKPDRCILQRMAFKGLLNAKVAFPRLCSSLLCPYLFEKKKTLLEWAPTKTQLHALSAITCVGTSTIH